MSLEINFSLTSLKKILKESSLNDDEKESIIKEFNIFDKYKMLDKQRVQERDGNLDTQELRNFLGKIASKCSNAMETILNWLNDCLNKSLKQEQNDGSEDLFQKIRLANELGEYLTIIRSFGDNLKKQSNEDRLKDLNNIYTECCMLKQSGDPDSVKKLEKYRQELMESLNNADEETTALINAILRLIME